jgi:hypothetical protein
MARRPPVFSSTCRCRTVSSSKHFATHRPPTYRSCPLSGPPARSASSSIASVAESAGVRRRHCSAVPAAVRPDLIRRRWRQHSASLGAGRGGRCFRGPRSASESIAVSTRRSSMWTPCWRLFVGGRLLNSTDVVCGRIHGRNCRQVR